MVEAAVAKGLAGMALTDHNSMKGVGEALEAAREHPGFLIVPGMEVSSQGGHILALGLREPVAPGLPVEVTIENITAAGALAAAAHPFRRFSGLSGENIRINRFDAVEVMNGRSLQRKNLLSSQLCEGLRLGTTAGSDGHNPLELGRCFVSVDERPGSAEGLLELVRKRQTRPGGVSATYTEVLRTGSKIFREWVGRGGKRI